MSACHDETQTPRSGGSAQGVGLLDGSLYQGAQSQQCPELYTQINARLGKTVIVSSIHDAYRRFKDLFAPHVRVAIRSPLRRP